MLFTTLDGIVDIDGNVYNLIKIGNQIWIAENLRTTKFRNGDPITYIYDPFQWAEMANSAYCNYNNKVSNGEKYGSLYNWYAVIDQRSIAPEGWHVPYDYEWITLFEFLGGVNYAGAKMKVEGTSEWLSPNYGATNSSKFSALPAGYITEAGRFTGLGTHAGYWSSTGSTSTEAWFNQLYYTMPSVAHKTNLKVYGYSVRLIKD